MKRFMFLLFAFLITVILVLPASVMAKKTSNDIRIGTIDKYTGDVLVRTRGTWRRLIKVPYPVFSSDKIVTKRGRAEVSFVDGGFIRVNLDSNLTIIQRQKKASMFSKKIIRFRQINVLAGSIWFDVKVSADKHVSFKTPSMTAAIRGTTGLFEVDAQGNLKFGLKTGKSDNNGTFTKIDLPKPITAADLNIKKEDLPPRNKALANLAIMKLAERAARQHTDAAKANRAKKIAKAAKKAAKKDLNANIKAALTKSKSAVDVSAAQVTSASEALEEAILMKDSAAIKAATDSLARAQAAFTIVKQDNIKIKTLATAARSEKDPVKAAIISQQANTQAEASAAKTATTIALAQVAIAAASGNADALKLAERQLTATVDASKQADNQATVADNLAEKAKTSSAEELAIIVVAAVAVSDAAATISANAEVQAYVAVVGTSGGDVAAAEELAANTNQLATAAEDAVVNIEADVEAGDVDKIEDAAKKTDDTSSEADKDLGTVESGTIVGGEIIIDEPKPDPKASPSG